VNGSLIVAVAILLLGSSPSSGQSGDVTGVKFTVEPSILKNCATDLGGVVSKISWDATAIGLDDVKIFVREGDRENLFASGGGKGSENTGPWVRVNMCFC
jgi:hypothetical protein